MGRPDPKIRDAMLAHLRRHHPDICRHWFDDIELLDMSGGTLKMLVREPVRLKYLQRSCFDYFKEAAQAAFGYLVSVRFLGEDELTDDGEIIAEPEARVRRGPETSTVADTPRFSSPEEEMLLSPDFSFQNFVIGPGNRLAHAAAYAVAQKPGRAYNPFFIHGGVGLGKTHLLQAICQAVMRSSPNVKLYYISCHGFMNQFVEAVQAGHMNEFRHRFRDVDLLVVDDIHDLSSRDRTQEEFFHTFNSLYQAGKQVVLSSDAAPSEIPSLEERLVSRFNCGLVARIEKPCFETRVAIVKSKASIRGVNMPDDVASYIANRIDSNIRELEGAINKIQSLAMIDNRPIDLELAKFAIGDHFNGMGAATPSVQVILEVISDFYEVPLARLLSKQRSKSIARPRQIGMYLARKHTRFSLEEIGSYFGGRDHTTVMHAIKTVEDKKVSDTALQRDVSALEERLTLATTKPALT